VIAFALSGWLNNYLAEFSGVAETPRTGKEVPKKRQIIDETPTGLAKNLTLKLQFWVGAWDWIRVEGADPAMSETRGVSAGREFRALADLANGS